MFLTILSGVAVFILGQFILKLVLEPIVSLKTVFGEISALFLREQAKITNANCSQEIQNEIKRLSASILANKQSIPYYGFFAFILRMPNEEELLKSCGSLNIISYQVIKDDKGAAESASKIYDEMKKVSKNLRITIEYGG
ncbi:conserved hypothetical protein [Desulfosarcina cetonica]|uniref:hypothetical protein n=1 Tax=Desulfosarcina cetonica TaxID=90730 RepID=UPI0006D1655A|nr:hypothetical protein [Desulfosarcina cetonica]VTR70677.1 conserved hypothetical protein [Desulfosarcina cetonica]